MTSVIDCASSGVHGDDRALFELVVGVLERERVGFFFFKIDAGAYKEATNDILL